MAEAARWGVVKLVVMLVVMLVVALVDGVAAERGDCGKGVWGCAGENSGGILGVRVVAGIGLSGGM